MTRECETHLLWQSSIQGHVYLSLLFNPLNNSEKLEEDTIKKILLIRENH